MKKLILRAFLLLLALLMVIPFAGCQKTPTPQETDPVTGPADTDPATDPEGTDPETDPEAGKDGPTLPEKNYGGEEFTILMRDLQEYTEDVYVESMEASSTSLERAVYQRLKDLCYAYNLVINPIIHERPKNEIPGAAKAGTDVFDLVVEQTGFSLSCAASGYYYDWNDLPYVNLEADWWSAQAAEELATPGGKLYTMVGDISHMSMGAVTCMFFNKELLGDVQGLASPYDLVRSGDWLFETFEEYVVTLNANMDGDGTGALETDTFGYATGWWGGPSQVLHSTGYRALEWKNEDWKFPLDNDTTAEAVFDMRDLLWNSGACYVVKHASVAKDFEVLVEPFRAGRVAFMDDRVANARRFAGADLSYGILPWPKYSKRVKEYPATFSAGTNIFAVMRNTSEENAKRISIILEAMAYAGHKDVMPLYFDTILSYQYLKDEESIEMLHIIHENLVIDFGYFYSKVCNLFADVATDETLGSLTKALDELEESAREDLYEKWNALDELEDEAA